jgi:asparagine synthase (glutamine-hydrolysing)
MCGIAGWIDWQQDLTQQGSVLKAMADTLLNRGPDAEGFWSSTHVGFAHRRLVIVDPNGGVQPMTRQQGDRSYTIVITVSYTTQRISATSCSLADTLSAVTPIRKCC